MADRLVAQHADDGTGHCRSCTSGAQTGRYRYPCDILLAVHEAARRHTKAADGAVVSA